MKHGLAVAFAAISLSLSGVGAGVSADDIVAGDFTFEQPWARPAKGGRAITAGYFRLVNEGATDRLVAASSDHAEVIELHTHLNENGMMRMMQVENFEVAEGGVLEFGPGGHHLMFFGIDDAFVRGATIPVTLTFETAGDITLDFPVKAEPEASPS